jgi:hypothetical protein
MLGPLALDVATFAPVAPTVPGRKDAVSAVTKYVVAAAATISLCSVIPAGGVIATFPVIPDNDTTNAPADVVVTDGAVIDFDVRLF